MAKDENTSQGASSSPPHTGFLADWLDSCLQISDDRHFEAVIAYHPWNV